VALGSFLELNMVSCWLSHKMEGGGGGLENARLKNQSCLCWTTLAWFERVGEGGDAMAGLCP
jgi:hypothetical protein